MCAIIYAHFVCAAGSSTGHKCKSDTDFDNRFLIHEEVYFEKFYSKSLRKFLQVLLQKIKYHVFCLRSQPLIGLLAS